MRILFIVKKQRFGYSGGGPSSGLYNSAKFVSDMIREKLHQHSKLVVVCDNNDIDREVTKFRPKIVVIEALWVEPSKFRVLKKLHPNVKWVVRNHSAMPFLAHEGIALEWLFKYAAIHRVDVACNDRRIQKELQILFKSTGENCEDVHYLPNYYPPDLHCRKGHFHENHLNIGCFGAIRSLKNQLIQAVAAIRYAEANRKILHFHVNTGRLEGDGEPILRNLIHLFAALPRHKLITHPWAHERKDFIEVVRRMDLGMQCSYSETFNIVTADFVMNDIPVVVSSEIAWAHPNFYADPNSSEDIAKKIAFALALPNRKKNVERLRQYDTRSVAHWKKFLAHE